MAVAAWPTPPIIGTRIRVLAHGGHPAEDKVVAGFDPSDGAVFCDDGEVVANHLDDSFARFEVVA